MSYQYVDRHGREILPNHCIIFQSGRIYRVTEIDNIFTGKRDLAIDISESTNNQSWYCSLSNYESKDIEII